MTDALPLLTLGQAARQLGVCVTTLQKLIARGHIVPIYPTGGKPRVTTLELERYVRETQQDAWDTQAKNVRWLRDHSSPIRGRNATASRNKKTATSSR